LEVFQRLEELIAASAAVILPSGAPKNDHFEWWRRTFEQTCRDHREELEAHFPWLNAERAFNKGWPRTVKSRHARKNSGV
jgi:hypothetical protein